MTDGFGDAFSKKILDYVFNAGAGFAPTTSIDVGLHTADPGAAGTTAEVAGNGYARVATTINTDWNAATTADPSVITNANAITFPQNITSDWGTITHFSLWDNGGAAHIGNGVVSPNKVVSVGDTPSFASGVLSYSLT